MGLVHPLGGIGVRWKGLFWRETGRNREKPEKPLLYRLEMGRSFVFYRLRRFLIVEPSRLEMHGKRRNGEGKDGDLWFEVAGSELRQFEARG
jgi:hypothetical protein